MHVWETGWQFLHRSDHPTYTVGIYLQKTIPWEYHLHTGIAETDVQMQVFIHWQVLLATYDVNCP